METAIRLGVADVIADVVETGTTSRRVWSCSAIRSCSEAIRSVPARSRHPAWTSWNAAERVLVARNYVMMDYDVTDALVEEACAITPGLESPTVSPLAKRVAGGPGHGAARGCPTDHGRLVGPGARAILVTDIAACRI